MLIDDIPPGWRDALGASLTGPSFARLSTFVAAERARTDTAIYPPDVDVFAALRLTPLASVRAVILGQDPYHGEGQAHGLAFSIPNGKALPPSLCNILDEWHADLGLPMPAGGCLEPWASHGVLLLNATLTVPRGKANSHHGQGWEDFTNKIVRVIAAKREPVAFLLWGRSAQRKRGLIGEWHIVIESTHPSPLSARRSSSGIPPFIGSRPFSGANTALRERSASPIDWSLRSTD
ncbi:MAG: uracil-DNA glycosylase [Candidatus Limnocylindrales bacterium]